MLSRFYGRYAACFLLVLLCEAKSETHAVILLL